MSLASHFNGGDLASHFNGGEGIKAGAEKLFIHVYVATPVIWRHGIFVNVCVCVWWGVGWGGGGGGGLQAP